VTVGNLFAVHAVTLFQTPKPEFRKKNSKEFKRTARSSSDVKVQFKGRASLSSGKAVRVGVQECKCY
jgi:hypothetical protein